MNPRWCQAAAGLVLAGLCAAVSAAQHCRDDIAASAPDSRFTDNGDGTVTDAGTGLMWKQCAEGLSGVGCATGAAAGFTWQGALQWAAGANDAGRTDWRLPNTNELESLVEQRCTDPAINASSFPNTPSHWFWSSSPYASYSGNAWYVDFGDGNVDGYYKYGARYVRLVRGGQ